MSHGFADLIVDNSESNADLRYVSGFAAPDDFLYFSVDNKRFIAVSDLESDRANREAKRGVTVLNLQKIAPGGSDLAAIIKSIRKKYSIERFRVPQDFPFGLAEKLRRENIPLEAVTGPFFPERARKSETEIALIREALAVTEQGMRRAFELLAACSIANDGKLLLDGEVFTSERLRREIDSELARCGASGVGTIAAGGVQGACPHLRGAGPLYAHTPIVMDIFPRHNDSGYYGDLTRTVVKGKAPAIVRKAFDAVHTVREECKAMVHAGVAGHIPHDHAARRFTELGFPTGESEKGFYGFFHGLGHGVGLEIHEAPRLSRKVSHLLEFGEVVTVEPGVYDPEWGGLRLEDMVVVREDRAECLTTIETFLEIE